MLKLRNGTFTIGETTILNNISLTVKKGECLVITGFSGSGKSSLLQILQGLFPRWLEGSWHGEIEWSPCIHSMYQIGAISQQANEWMLGATVEEEIALMGEQAGCSPKWMRKRMQQLLESFELINQRKEKVEHLSSGEQQKVAIARVLMHDPKVLLFDEPTANLDRNSRQNFGIWLKKWKEEGKTIIIVDHQLAYLKDIADRYVWMENGQIKKGWSQEEFHQLSEEDCQKYGLQRFELFETVAEQDLIYGDMFCEQFVPKYSWLRSANLPKWTGQLPKQGICGVVGKNGVGKTTLLEALIGFRPHFKGKVKCQGRNWTARKRLEESWLVSQQLEAQFFTSSVKKEFQLIGDFTEQTISEILSRYGLQGCLNKHPSVLSGGEKQRLLIALALTTQQKVIVLDEPTSALDGVSWGKVVKEIKKASRSRMIWIITHDLKLLANMATTVLVVTPEKVGYSQVSNTTLSAIYNHQFNSLVTR